MITKLLLLAALTAFGSSQAVPPPPTPPAPPNPTPLNPTTTGSPHGSVLPNVYELLLYFFRDRNDDNKPDHHWGSDNDGDSDGPFDFDQNGDRERGNGVDSDGPIGDRDFADSIQRTKRQAEEAFAPVGPEPVEEGEPGEDPEPEATENRDGDNNEDIDEDIVQERVKRNHDEDGQQGNGEGESANDPQEKALAEPEGDVDVGGQREKRQNAAAAARPVNPCMRKECPDNFDCVVRRVCPRPRQCRLVARCIRDRDNTRSNDND